ncbi:hypothetical protein [Desulfovibrio inopinatus]|uniref:hypothetical protein n=1 Tax=Desulfovibrio inopinatus TaxID=102109 RepID=UPI00042489C6|nr:hypothetical protein [Desulfovibrio inopinatus]
MMKTEGKESIELGGEEAFPPGMVLIDRTTRQKIEVLAQALVEALSVLKHTFENCSTKDEE